MATLGFIGAGNMAEAIAKAAIDGGGLRAEQMIAADPSDARREVFASLGVTVAESNADAIKQSEQVLLAVKPQMMEQAAADLAGHLRDDQIVISIMAGITTRKLTDTIESLRPQASSLTPRIVRVMPNTPMMVGHGMAGVALGEHAHDGDDALAMQLFSAGDSQALRVKESELDAITAVSGSGPAYLFYLAEAMRRAAVHLGLKPEHASVMVEQTILGATKLMRESDEPPEELRRKVTSPGGTTEAAINHMESNKTIDVIVHAIKAAEARSRELGE